MSSEEKQSAVGPALDRQLIAQALVVAALCTLDVWLISQMLHGLAVLGTLVLVIAPLGAIVVWIARPAQPSSASSSAADRSQA